MRHMNSPAIAKRVGACVAVTMFLFALVSFVAAPVASAEPRSSLEAQKRQVQAELDELNARLDDAVEAYNDASYRLSRTRARAATLERDIARTKARLRTLEGRLGARARSLYMGGGDNVLLVFVGSRSFSDLIANWRAITSILDTESRLTADYRAQKSKLERFQADLARTLREQERAVAQLRKNKKRVEALVAARERKLRSINAELLEIIRREELARREALARAARRYVPPAPVPRVTVSRGSSRSAHSSVVSIALSLLGRPYRWGASGPYAFDCSGFTMYVYAQVGISLPHSSAAQYGCGDRVSYSELEPGDLVFFARRGGRISHVGIYIGNGLFVHAPQTGDVVKVSSLADHAGFVGGCRP